MDTFVMQHKEAGEEERDYLTCWQSQAVAFHSSRHCPHPTPKPRGGWENERQSYPLIILPKLPLPHLSPSTCRGAATREPGTSHKRFPGSRKQMPGSPEKMPFLICTGRKASKNTCKQRHFIFGFKQQVFSWSSHLPTRSLSLQPVDSARLPSIPAATPRLLSHLSSEDH